MAADDLNTPLGLPPEPRSRRGMPLRGLTLGAIGCAAVVAAAIGVFFFSRGDQSTAVAIINAPRAGPTSVSPEVTGSIAKAAPATAPSAAPAGPALTEMAATGGISAVDTGEVVVQDPSQPAPVRLAAAPREGLTEEGPYGVLPRVGDDGTRPLEAYARPADAVIPGSRRIAIVVGGVGLGEDSTEQAIDKLPGAMTLAFAPYGGNLSRTLAQARAAGHEILLQVPLEPFDYPKNNPGPYTLTSDASNATNIDRLHWLLSRVTTYVGVVNYMGARFTGDSDKLAPVLAEIGRRGLLYLDDGSSARSRAADTAGTKVPFLRADVVLDGDADPAAMADRLDQLVAIARERGYAIGVATAFPTSIDRLADFAKTAASHGIVFVPVSSLVQSGRS